MKILSIQYGLPCKDPVNNVVVRRGPTVVHIEIPINYPDIHKISIQTLLDLHGLDRNDAVEITHKPNNTIALPKSKQ